MLIRRCRTCGPAADSDNQGDIQFPPGLSWVKGLSVKAGQAQLCPYQDLLKNFIENRKYRPSFVFEKEFRVE